MDENLCDLFSQWETIADCVVMEDVVDLCSLHM